MRALWSLLGGSLLLVSCGDSSRPVGKTKLTIESPVHESTVLSFKPLKFSVTATNRLGIQAVELRVGDVLAKTCEGNNADEVTCTIEALQPTEFSEQVKNGSLVLKATAIEKGEGVNEDLVRVSVKPIRVAFVKPEFIGDPPTATVTGTSLMQLDVESQVVIDYVQVSDGKGSPLRRFTGGPYEADMEWATMLGGTGAKVLKAEAVDTEGNKDVATINVKVE